MTELTKGTVVLAEVKSPPGSPAKVIYAGLGAGALYGKTLFDVFIDDLYYGFFTLTGMITRMEEAQARLLAPMWEGIEETVAEYHVCYQYVHVDDNESYGAG